MVKIFTDTNILRYFGEAFATKSVPAELGNACAWVDVNDALSPESAAAA
jgi:hypothetical protein